jgi:hypothetical protein
MVLSNQSELLAFLSRKVNLKISHRILSNPTISEDDLPRLAKKNPAYEKPELARPRKI